jgi:hypothetical protein
VPIRNANLEKNLVLLSRFRISCFRVLPISDFESCISNSPLRYLIGVITSRWAALTAACNWASSNAIIEVRSTGI